ncbi:thioredoxin [Desulfofarcimen acetoxidans]|uniref:thioredoxin n=1 Tax=Desulfofarcimen acetoxidans TaxID=58138 RepID=UPI00019E50CF|nr:thioredoxin [Desulfofarcimen acetoxidans]
MAVNALSISTDDEFEQLINNSQVPVIVYFWAEWCLPCKIISPVIDTLVDEFAGKILIAKLDSDNCKEIVKHHKVYSIPTVMILKNGIETERLIGSRHRDELQRAILRNIK